MLTCKCGGFIAKGSLVDGRERWWCSACRRYEVLYRPKEGKDEDLFSNKEVKNQQIC